jgi:hypothetical protein
MEIKPEIMDKIIPIADEMGEKRLEEYMKVYLKLNKDKNYFFKEFAEYIESRKEDKNGYKRISISSFKSYILEVPSIEEKINKIELYENLEDPLDEFFID